MILYNSLVLSQFVFTARRALGISFLVFLCSCAKDINTKEAVKEAVLKRISARGDLNMSSMDVDISNVSFQGKTAEATVAFKAKGSAEAMMNVNYKLEREGDAWVVKSTGAGGTEGIGGAPDGGHSGGEKK